MSGISTLREKGGVIHLRSSPMLTLSDYRLPREEKHSVLDRLTKSERDYVLAKCERRLAKRHSLIFRQVTGPR